MSARQNKAKVFNIGFHRTGTTSLSMFMQELGFKVLHSVPLSMNALNLGVQEEKGEGDGCTVNFQSLIDPVLLDKLIRRYDFFSDNPWPLLYSYIDKNYPGSRFILTRRNVNDWIQSLIRYFGSSNTLMRCYIYGYGNPVRHIEKYKHVYMRHNDAVLEHFNGKDNLLVYDLEEDDDVIAEKILCFLGLKGKDARFPSINVNQKHSL